LRSLDTGFHYLYRRGRENLAPTLQSALHCSVGAFVPSQVVWIFRDKTGLSAISSLWKKIERALAGFEYLLLMTTRKARPHIGAVRGRLVAEQPRRQHIAMLLTEDEIVNL